MAAACGGKTGDARAACEREFAAMQARGHGAMGVDQYTAVHVFDDLPDGGRIELQADSADTAGVAPVRAHLQAIAAAFAEGDFTTPGFVHAQEVPGTRVMKDLRANIRYEYHALERGGEVLIRTSDVLALRAIHEFLAFQRQEHRAAGVRR
jgi:hypothetical protein